MGAETEFRKAPTSFGRLAFDYCLESEQRDLEAALVIISLTRKEKYTAGGIVSPNKPVLIVHNNIGSGCFNQEIISNFFDGQRLCARPCLATYDQIVSTPVVGERVLCR
jgi:hypothetical protein